MHPPHISEIDGYMAQAVSSPPRLGLRRARKFYRGVQQIGSLVHLDHGQFESDTELLAPFTSVSYSPYIGGRVGRVITMADTEFGLSAQNVFDGDTPAFQNHAARDQLIGEMYSLKRHTRAITTRIYNKARSATLINCYIVRATLILRIYGIDKLTKLFAPNCQYSAKNCLDMVGQKPYLPYHSLCLCNCIYMSFLRLRRWKVLGVMR